jgi:O-antigen/teichoic acid export membrane protein
MNAAANRSAFFRQSGWLMVVNVLGGMMMWAVHFLSKPVGPTEYGIFVAMLSVTICIPGMPLQIVIVQQIARGLAIGQEKEMRSLVRTAWLVTTLLWIMAVLVVLFYQQTILQRWGLTPTVMWLTFFVILMGIWQPVFWGALQGTQNFFWLGWSMLSNAVLRVGVAAVTVLVFKWRAVGMLSGVLAGMVISTLISMWQLRSLILGPGAFFNWRPLLLQMMLPLIGFAAFQFLFSGDTMFVKSYFDKDTAGFYGSAGTLARALMWLVGPLATVMFPRLVHSSVKSEKSNLLGLVLLGTAVLSVLGAISLSILGPFIVRLVSGKAYVAVASGLLPWYSATMIPLALSNVLLNSLLARSSFKIAPVLLVLAVGYGFALANFHDTPITVLKVMGLFNLVVLVVCCLFIWQSRGTVAPAPAPAPIV